jgi:hemolysin activation/secretion protein
MMLVASAGLALPLTPTLALAGDQQPYDLNAVRAGQPGGVGSAAQPAPSVGATTETGGGDVVTAVTPALNGPETYSVSRFVLEYRSDHPQQPTLEELMGATVRLGVLPDRFDAPDAGVPTTTIRLRDVMDGNPGVFTPRALGAVAQGLVREINTRGVGSVVVQVHPDDIDAETGADLRPNARGDLRLVVWTGIIGNIRTIAAGERLEKKIQDGTVERVDSADRVHARIRAQSPVQPGELMGQQAVADYLYRLNRHPGRRVDAAVAPGDAEQQISLDYIVQESKPWTIYGQISNTGTEQTSEFRERVGFVHNQLTKSDDILRLDYITGNFRDSHALLGSYEFPLRSDITKIRLYGNYSEFDASEVGLGNESFSGVNYAFGGEVSRTIYQRKQFFVDAVGGARWQSVKVTNDLFAESGKAEFIIPNLGLRAERITDVSALTAGIMFELQSSSLSSFSTTDLQALGRPQVDDDWKVLKFDVAQSFHIEPLISDVFWGTGDSGPTTLAHEVSVGLRGQYAFGDRLIANEQDVLGGLYTVRGYPESIAAGDTTVVGTLEYRYHVPRAWAVSAPGYRGDRKINFFRRTGGDDFRYAPSEAFGFTDWDLILKTFVDAGKTDVSDAVTGESDETLVGAGVGFEFQFKRNLQARLDWGFALSDIDASAEPVDAGDNRVHFVLTVSY